MSSSFCRAFILCVVGSAMGCFNPRLKNDGFACVASTVDPCPDGYTCINGVCDDGSGHPPALTTPDLAMPVAADLSMPVMSVTDMAQPPVADMAKPSVPDLALGPDMAPPVCAADGNSCAQSTDCCSGHCHTRSTHTCFTSP